MRSWSTSGPPMSSIGTELRRTPGSATSPSVFPEKIWPMNGANRSVMKNMINWKIDIGAQQGSFLFILTCQSKSNTMVLPKEKEQKNGNHYFKSI